MTPDETIAELSTLLDRERETILRGAITEIDALTRRKISLMPGLIGLAEVGAVRQLRIKAARNTALLNAAMSGMKTALSRLEALHGGSVGLETYDKSGRRRTVGFDRNALERKA